MAALVDLQNLPAHIAVVMDGNGRWAERQHQHRTFGHQSGSEAVRRTVRASRRLGIRALTLYAFSEQNWQRPSSEIEILMQLLEEFLAKEREEVIQNQIRFIPLGRTGRLPQKLVTLLRALEEETRHMSGMALAIALSYGGREEIADAAQSLARQVEQGSLRAEQVTLSALENTLPSMQVGEVDLLIRTGGEQRISNFLLWGAAYAELYFSQTFWPDFGERDLYEAICAYQSRERRYGKLSRAESVPLLTSNADGVTS
ncbi:MAG: di-trans,poly-cis-decaprenylcistransferase [Myxococcales bacterium]|nr:di-trans,poly-cis-decaprenylcistransferase [Myxococcales bacterium]